MTTVEPSTLIELFGRHRRIGLLRVESPQSSLTLRNPSAASPPELVADLPEPPTTEVASTAVGVWRLRPQGEPETAMGATVEDGQELGWIETGSRRTPVLAPAAGEIVAVEATDGEFVEFGQPLLKLVPTAANHKKVGK